MQLELKRGQTIGVPALLTGGAGEVKLAIHTLKTNLDPPVGPSLAALGGYIDDPASQ
jgi:hypothetical protein